MISRTPPELAAGGTGRENRRPRGRGPFKGLPVISARSLVFLVCAFVAAAPAVSRAETFAIVVAGDPGKKATVVDATAPWPDHFARAAHGPFARSEPD